MNELNKYLSDYSYYSLNSVKPEDIYKKKYNCTEEKFCSRLDLIV